MGVGGQGPRLPGPGRDTITCLVPDLKQVRHFPEASTVRTGFYIPKLFLTKPLETVRTMLEMFFSLIKIQALSLFSMRESCV